MKPKSLEQSFDKRAVGHDHPPGETRAAEPGRDSYDERLNRILEAATGVFAREGYAKASMRSVAKAANVSLAGMYHYFDGKENILFLIQFRAFSSLLNNLRERICGVREPIKQLRIMVHAHVGYFASNMAALKVCSHELDSLSGEAFEETRRIRFEYYKIARSIIDSVVETYAPDVATDRHVMTMSLFGMLNWLYRWYSPGKERSSSGLANQLVSIFLGGTIGNTNPEKECIGDNPMTPKGESDEDVGPPGTESDATGG
ncbi:MAG: TetR/AcrR family transcriptional regulator [Planctomycetota bacterium]|jgi:AcrR family transcriptional regulator